MQRITRLPLLVDTIRHRLDPGIPRHISASKALEKLNRIVRQCNDGAKKMLQTEQICLLAANLEFKIKVGLKFYQFEILHMYELISTQNNVFKITVLSCRIFRCIKKLYNE